VLLKHFTDVRYEFMDFLAQDRILWWALVKIRQWTVALHKRREICWSAQTEYPAFWKTTLAMDLLPFVTNL